MLEEKMNNNEFVKENSGYLNKPTIINEEALKRMSKTPIKKIITSSIEEVGEFLNPSPEKYSKGFIIRKKKHGGDKNL